MVKRIVGRKLVGEDKNIDNDFGLTEAELKEYGTDIARTFNLNSDKDFSGDTIFYTLWGYKTPIGLARTFFAIAEKMKIKESIKP